MVNIHVPTSRAEVVRKYFTRRCERAFPAFECRTALLWLYVGNEHGCACLCLSHGWACLCLPVCLQFLRSHRPAKACCGHRKWGPFKHRYGLLKCLCCTRSYVFVLFRQVCVTSVRVPFQATARFQGSNFSEKAMKMVLTYILSVIFFHLWGFEL